MKLTRFLPASFILLFFGSAQAQIFINTGNPNIVKYKSENPNAVIWEKGKNVPMPPNTPDEPKENLKKTVKAETVKAEPAKKEVQKTIPEVTPIEPVQTEEKVFSSKPVVNKNGAPDFPADGIPGKCYAHLHGARPI